MNEQPPNDKELLGAYTSQGDESAFAELMRRHGGVVRAAARNVVGAASIADDIAQATFLALARKARSLSDREGSLAGWLYRVATCLARNARRDEIRRTAREEKVAMLAFAMESDTDTDTSPSLGEAALAALCEELGNLAEKYRQPVILHHLQGLSYETAAPLCGCNGKTFSMRLTRGREQLRKRLSKRGVTLGAMALVAGLSQSVASAAELPAALVASTCQAATAVAAGGSVAGGGLVSAKVAALTDSALRMLFWGQVKTVAAVCAGIAVLGGTGLTVATLLTHPPQPETRQAAVVAPVDAPMIAPVVAPVLAVVSNAAATADREDSAILFQDSFEDGLGKWNLYAKRADGKQAGAVENDVRIVAIERDGQRTQVAALTGTEPGGQRVGIVMKALGVKPESFSISYDYTYEGRQRLALEGILFNMRSMVLAKGKTIPEANPPGVWNTVRMEFVRKSDQPENGFLRYENTLFFNGERIGSRFEYTTPEEADPHFSLVVGEGQFRFDNVVIREMKK